MTTNTTIKLGFTFDYFIPGVLLIIIGGVTYFANFIVATSILLLGISLIVLRSGIEIDPNKKRVRRFYELLSIRFGGWIGMKNFEKVELKFTNESQTLVSRGGQRTYETKTYDIVFVDHSGFSRELNDFRNYNVAVQTLDLISKTFSLKSTNEIAEIRKAALERRKDNTYRK